MDTLRLAALVPDFMQSHPGHAWRLLSGEEPAEDLVVEVWPASASDRVATVRVHRGAEVYWALFAGHEGIDFASSDDDAVEALQDRLALAVEATAGPTRVTLDRVGEAVVRSRMTLDPDGPSPREDATSSRPIRRLAARLRGRRIARVTIDGPGLPE